MTATRRDYSASFSLRLHNVMLQYKQLLRVQTEKYYLSSIPIRRNVLFWIATTKESFLHEKRVRLACTHYFTAKSRKTSQQQTKFGWVAQTCANQNLLLVADSLKMGFSLFSLGLFQLMRGIKRSKASKGFFQYTSRSRTYTPQCWWPFEDH